MSEWFDKAKEAAKQAAEEARKLADKAKNADYSAMLEKTKTMAKEAAEEARKAADTLRGKTSDTSTAQSDTTQSTMQSGRSDNTMRQSMPNSGNPDYQACVRQLEKVEALLQDIKRILRS